MKIRSIAERPVFRFGYTPTWLIDTGHPVCLCANRRLHTVAYMTKKEYTRNKKVIQSVILSKIKDTGVQW